MRERLYRLGYILLACCTLVTGTVYAKGEFEEIKPPRADGTFHRSLPDTGTRISSHEEARDWVQNEFHDWLGLSEQDSLQVSKKAETVGDYTFYRISQKHNDIPVVGLDAVLATQSGTPSYVLGRNHRLNKLSKKTKIQAKLAKTNSGLVEDAEHDVRITYLRKSKQQTHLAYEITGTFKTDEDAGPERVFVDAKTGKVLERYPLEYSALKRYIFDVGAACRSMGISQPIHPSRMEIVMKRAVQRHQRVEGGRRSNSRDVEQLYDFMGDAYTYMKTTFGMDSIDNRGLRLAGFAGVKYNSRVPGRVQCVGNRYNAQWNGRNNVLYIPRTAIPYTEVVAHELAHGIISNGSKLVYKYQSGALNEAIADAIGVTFRAWLKSGGRKGNPINRIRTSRDIYRLRGPNMILRDMASPRRKRDPDHFYDFVRTQRDHGGVHTNSGIINQAFYLLAEGGKHPRLQTGPYVEAIGIKKASQIYALAGSNILTPHASFEDARYAFALAAKTLFGKKKEWISVHKSMDAVGISGRWSMPRRQQTQPRQTPPPPPKPVPQPRPQQTPAPAPTPTPAPQPQQQTPKQKPPKTTPEPTPSQPQPAPAEQAGKPGWAWIIFAVAVLALVFLVINKIRPRYNDKQGYQPTAEPTPAPGGSTPAIAADTHLGSLMAMDQSEPIPLPLSLLGSKEGLVIGRAPELVHVEMESQDISRRHARLRLSNGHLVVEDMHSTHGTQIDGDKLSPFKPMPIQDGQIVRFAGHAYQLKKLS